MTWKDLEDKLKEYVTLDRYSPVEKLVYGMAGAILLAVLAAVLAYVIRKPM